MSTDQEIFSIFPIADAPETCGNIGMRHDWTNLGTDIRNCGERGFQECRIRACQRCGRDDSKRIK